MNNFTVWPPASTQGNELRREYAGLFMPAIFATALLLLFASPRPEHPLQVGLPALLLLLLPIGTWFLLKRYERPALTLLWAGVLAVGVGAMTWGGQPYLAALLIVPLTLAFLLSGTLGGVVALVAVGLLLGLAPPDLLPLSTSERGAMAVQMIIVLWLVWVAQRPLLVELRITQQRDADSRDAVEQMREHQLRLNAALHDLAEANTQLTRLNRLAAALRQQAEEARAAKQKFVANVSHELRTPLNMISGFIEMITQTPQTYGAHVPQALLADLAIVLRNSRHLAGLIDDILDLSQIDVGRMPLVKEPCDIDAVINAACMAVQPLYQSKNLWLRREVAPGMPRLLCDETRIRQVILNLLSNAGRFTEQGGVTVTARRDQDFVWVSVGDTGPGIAPEDVERIFEPFAQIDTSLHRKHGGSGLGLGISRHFVELHDGMMWAEGELGKGATFHFRLPLQPIQETSSATRWFAEELAHKDWQRPRPNPRGPLPARLLVVEEQPVLERLVRRYLTHADVVSVTSLEAAADQLAHNPAHAILLNAASVEQGLAYLAAGPALPGEIPAIVCAIPGVQQSADKLGALRYLVKPIDREKLRQELDSLPTSPQTILVADDDDEAQRLLRRMLASYGRNYRVLRAMNGQETLACMRRERPDVVLLDLVMPEMDGFQLLAMRQSDPELAAIPVIVVSAQDPSGQPIVSQALAVSRRGGLSVRRLLAGIGALLETMTLQPLHLSLKDGEELTPPRGLAQEGSGAEGLRELALGQNGADHDG